MTELNKIADQHNWSEVYNIADTYRQQQQWRQAAIAFQRAIELQPDFFWSYHHLGDALSHLQQWQRASLAYSHAVEIDPNFFWSWHNLGDALSKLQQWQQASLAYSRAVEIDPSFFWSWHNLGDALSKLQQWDRAIAVYLQALQLKPTHQLTYQKLGTAFKQRGDLETSIKYYRQLIHSAPTHIFSHLKTKPQSLLTLAEALVIQHQTNAAIVLYYMALEILPNQTATLLKLAELIQQQNQLQQKIISRQQTLPNKLLIKPTANIAIKPKLNNIPGQIIIKSNNLISSKQLEELSSAVGWSPRPLDQVKQALENSLCYISAWHIHEQKQQLIGFARAVGDGVFYAVLLDILVHPDYQNRGLGTRIVRTLIEKLQPSKISNITLFTNPHLVDFYHKLGFVCLPDNLQWMLWCDD
jgi:Tfp pilus assembly protein PilF/GNAT superfamily N-acetyltransferase